MKKNTIFGLEQILEILPHRPPFLFIDRVIKFIPDKILIAERKLLKDEPWFKGHFPEKPIMPGVLVVDALAQASGLLLGFSKKSAKKDNGNSHKLFYLASSNMKYLKPALPGETLELITQSENKFADLHSFNVEAFVGRNVIAKGSLMLAQAKGKI